MNGIIKFIIVLIVIWKFWVAYNELIDIQDKNYEIYNLFYKMGLEFFTKVVPMGITEKQLDKLFKKNIDLLIQTYISKLTSKYSRDYILLELKYSVSQGKTSKFFNPFEYMEKQIYACAIILRRCAANTPITDMLVNEVFTYVKTIFPNPIIANCGEKSEAHCFTAEELTKILAFPIC
jgi:hypothetical protein